MKIILLLLIIYPILSASIFLLKEYQVSKVYQAYQVFQGHKDQYTSLEIMIKAIILATYLAQIVPQ